MGRQLLGYLLLVICLLLVAGVALRAWHNSSRRSYKRRRRADEARLEARDRDRDERAPPAV
jgi:hypothetical protein